MDTGLVNAYRDGQHADPTLHESMQELKEALAFQSPVVKKALNKYACALFLRRIGDPCEDLSTLSVGHLMYDDCITNEEFISWVSYKAGAQAMRPETVANLAAFVVAGTTRSPSSVTAYELLVHCDSVLRNLYKKAAYMMGFVGLQYFLPTLAMSALFPGLDENAIYQLLIAFKKYALAPAENFTAKFKAVDHAASFPNTLVQPAETSFMFRNSMFDDFIRWCASQEGSSITCKLYAAASVRFNAAMGCHDKIVLAEHLRSMYGGVEAVGGGYGEDKFDALLDAVYGGRAYLGEDGTIMHDVQDLDLEDVRRTIEGSQLSDGIKDIICTRPEKKKPTTTKKKRIKPVPTYGCDGYIHSLERASV